MKRLPYLFYAFSFFGSILSCQQQPDAAKANMLYNLLDSLTQSVKPTDEQYLKTIDGLLAQIESFQVESIDLKVAEICHKALGSYLLSEEHAHLARKYSLHALEIRKRVYKNDTTHIDIVRLYHNLGEAYRLEGKDLDKALHYFDAADDVQTPAYFKRVYFLNMMHRGMVFSELGEKPKALEDFQRAFRYFQDSLHSKTNNYQGAFILHLLNDYASCYRTMQHYREGLEKANIGNLIARKMEIDSSDAAALNDHVEDAAGLLMVTANLWQDSMVVSKSALERSMAYDSAVLYFKMANKLFDIARNDKDKVLGMSNLGALYSRAGKLKDACSILSAGIDTSQIKNLDSIAAPLYINRGYVFQKQNKIGLALQNYQHALTSFGGSQWNEATGFPALSTLQGKQSRIFTLLINIATSWMDSARIVPGRPEILAKAAIASDSMQAFAEIMRNSLMSDGAKLELAKEAQKWVGHAVESNLQLYRVKQEDPEGARYLERAFMTAEQGKAFALLDAARLRNARSSLPASIRQEELDVLEAVSKAGDEPMAKAKAEQRKRKFFAKLAREQPQFFNLKYQKTGISLGTIQKDLLARDQAMVEYACTDSVLYCFLLTPDQVSVDSVQISKKALAGLVANYQNLIERDNPNLEEQQAFIQCSHQLYQLLLAKLSRKLDLYPRLIIIPDAPLNNLSFDGLLFRTSAGDVRKQVDDENFLVFKHALSYCFSANLLWEMQQHKVPAKLEQKVAVFVPDASRKSEVERLVESGFGVVQKNDTDAFWDACSRFAFAHVAGHGNVDEENPGLSHIKFSDSNRLLLNDLYNHPIDLEMVALSACETTKGQYSEGDGNLSLARGLAYAGVRSFISTQWVIPTDGPRKIMPLFYDTLFLDKMPKDLAFAKAKRTFLRGQGFRGPKNWAGMVFIGACEVAAPAQKTCWAVWAVLLLALAIGGWYVYRKKPNA